MKKRAIRLVGLAGAVAWMLGASSASAIGTTYGATFSGTASGTDALGLFGAKGANLAADPYTETFLINTLIGSKRTSSSQQDEWSTSSGFITATLTINGKSVTVRSSDFGEAFVNNGGNVSSSSTGIIASGGYGGSNTYHAVYDYAAGSSSIPGGYIGELTGYADNSSASFKGFPTGLDQAFSVAVGSAGTTGGGAFMVYVDGCLTEVESLALHETVAAAPEPGTWCLLVVGVGILGASLRQRRRHPSALRLAA